MTRGQRFGLLAILLVLLSGCGDQRAPSNTAIVLAIAVSARHQWTFLFPNPAVTVSSLASKASGSEFYTISVTASSYPAALARVQEQSARVVFTQDVKVIVLGAALSGPQVAQIVSSMTESGLVPARAWLVATQASPAQVLMHYTPQTTVPVYALADYFDCASCHYTDLGVRGWQWWVRSMTPGVSPVLPVARPTATGLDVSRLLVYPTQGRPVLMPAPLTVGWAYLSGKVHEASLALTVDGHPYVLSSMGASARVRCVRVAGTVDVTVRMQAHGEIANSPPQRVLLPQDETRVEAAGAAALAHLAARTISWANHTHTDPFGYAMQASWGQPADVALTPLPIRARIWVTVRVQGEGMNR
ncbi:MAG: Ger(x)C family spore germination C-terminal domain-containing protein [Clostridia bacterium]